MTTARRQRTSCAPGTRLSLLSLTLAIAITATVTACSANRGPTSSSAASSGRPTEANEATTSPSTTRPSAADTPIRIRLGERTMTARLDDNATARDLVGQLPLTLTFRDFNRLEKIAALPLKLPTNEVPAGADPDIGDIGYYAPSGDLVFYYGDVGYFSGIVRIGRFDSDLDFIRQQPDGFTVTIERAD
jgi:hypothetical protein